MVVGEGGRSIGVLLYHKMSTINQTRGRLILIGMLESQLHACMPLVVIFDMVCCDALACDIFWLRVKLFKVSTTIYVSDWLRACIGVNRPEIVREILHKNR